MSWLGHLSKEWTGKSWTMMLKLHIWCSGFGSLQSSWPFYLDALHSSSVHSSFFSAHNQDICFLEDFCGLIDIDESQGPMCHCDGPIIILAFLLTCIQSSSWLEEEANTCKCPHSFGNTITTTTWLGNHCLLFFFLVWIRWLGRFGTLFKKPL